MVVAWLTGRALVQVRPDLSRLFSRPFRTHGSKELCSLADLCRVHAHGGWAASPSPLFFLTGVGRLPPPPSCAGPTFHTRSAPLSLLASALTCPVLSAEFGWLTVSFPCQPLGSALLRYRTHAVVWRLCRQPCPPGAGSDEVDNLRCSASTLSVYPRAGGLSRPTSPLGH